MYNDGGFDVTPCGKYLITCAHLRGLQAAASFSEIAKAQALQLSAQNHTQDVWRSRLRERAIPPQPTMEDPLAPSTAWLIMVSLEKGQMGELVQFSRLDDILFENAIHVEAYP